MIASFFSWAIHGYGVFHARGIQTDQSLLPAIRGIDSLFLLLNPAGLGESHRLGDQYFVSVGVHTVGYLCFFLFLFFFSFFSLFYFFLSPLPLFSCSSLRISEKVSTNRFAQDSKASPSQGEVERETSDHETHPFPCRGTGGGAAG